MCTQDCPRRQGFRRRDVAAMLAIGRVPRGLHPDSVLLSIAIAIHRHSEATERERHQTLCTQITELQAVLEEQRQRASELVANGRSDFAGTSRPARSPTTSNMERMASQKTNRKHTESECHNVIELVAMTIISVSLSQASV